MIKTAAQPCGWEWGFITIIEVIHFLYFYDTCALLNVGEAAFDEHFIISAQTLIELEDIKTSRKKDETTKHKARTMAHLLDKWSDAGIYVVAYSNDFYQDDTFEPRYILPDSPDFIICYEAWQAHNNDAGIIFCTDDLCCKNIAANLVHIPVCSSDDILKPDDYKGYKEVTLTDEELAALYENPGNNKFSLIPGQYLIARDAAGEVTGLFKWLGDTHVVVEHRGFKTDMFGAVRGKDEYQKLALDSLASNKLTMLCGPAGTGKSYLALAHLFKLLETHRIDKIIVFTNPCATNGAARLGFYPGTRDEKLLDSQIGNMLGAKFGDKIELQRQLDAGKLQLLPFSDLRGFDTTGKNCAVYITEAQNLDIEMMRLALQRIGEDSICIIDGDYDAQVDMDSYAGEHNGMKRLSKVFRGHDFYGEIKLKNIYRSKITELAQQL